MTLTPDRIDELDFPTPHYGRDDLSAPTAIEWQEAMDEAEQEYQGFLQERLNNFTDIAQQDVLQVPRGLSSEDFYAAVRRVMDEREIPYHEQFPHDRGLYCFCSPSRGQFFERYMTAAGPVAEFRMTARTWHEPDFGTFTPPGVHR